MRVLDRNRFALGVACAVVGTMLATPSARAQEQLLFPSHQDARNAIVARINAETVRLDIATWYLTDRLITSALINRHSAGVRVRVIGDRVSIFEIDAFTRREFEHLASNGVPIRLRFHPTSFPQIMHWKSGIFVGQGVVEFGSANWTSFELQPVSSTNFKDETVLFTADAALVSAFKSRFDQFWANTTQFLDWPAAYERETGQPWTTPMQIDRRRLEPDVTGPSTMVWEQGPGLNNRMTAEISAETAAIDFVVYRLSNANITNALLNRRQAGVPVRVFVEPTQYRQDTWPEYWLTGARIDQLWAAGARIKERTHAGLTHMKVLITSRYAMHGSSNFTNNWQRDHNYFIPASSKPGVYAALRTEFDRMWTDSANYRDFYPRPPATPVLASPAHNAAGVSRTPRLVWNRTPWAVAFDVYLGTSTTGMAFQGRVNSVLTENPPATYSWTPSVTLQPGTQYYWYIVARTFASDIDPSITTASAVRSFVTAGSSGGGGGGGGGGSSPYAGLRLAGAEPVDFDGDGRADLGVYRPSNGTWYALLSSAQYGASLSRQWGVSTDVPVPGDYDGDGRTDLAVYRPSTGAWYVLLSGSGYGTSMTRLWGTVTDIPVPGDYDGDGRTDLAVFRPSNGTWYVLLSSFGYGSALVRPWGTSTDVPVAADYDGDGRTDLAVYRPSMGTWYVLQSMSGFATSVSRAWGNGTDRPVPGDYDGDGRADFAVFRPANGTWFVLQSSTGFAAAFTRQWGTGTDVPVSGDFDGDRRADAAVFRPATGTWFVWNQFSRQWGLPTDIPLSRR